MNWDAIGAVGQWVGAIAVVLTLGYLVRQIRDSNVQMRRAELNAAQAQFSQWRQALMRDADLARIWSQGMQNPSQLTAVELVRLDQTLTEVAYAMYHVWDRNRVGASDPGEWERVSSRGFSRLISSPYGRIWWDGHAGGFPPAFGTEVERLAAAPPAPAP